MFPSGNCAGTQLIASKLLATSRFDLCFRKPAANPPRSLCHKYIYSVHFLYSYCTSTMFPTQQSPRPIKRQRLMTPHSRGNGLVNGKVNSQQQQQQHQQQQQLQHQLQQQMMLSTSPLANGGGFHHHHGYVSGHNGIGIGATATGLPPMVVGMMHDVANTANGCNNDLGPFKVYSKSTSFSHNMSAACFVFIYTRLYI